MKVSAEATPSYLWKVVKNAPSHVLNRVGFIDFIYVTNADKRKNFNLTEELAKHKVKVPKRCYRHENIRKAGTVKRVATKELLCDSATVAIFREAKKDKNGRVTRGRKILTGISFCSKSEPTFDHRIGRIKAVADAVRTVAHTPAPAAPAKRAPKAKIVAAASR